MKNFGYDSYFFSKIYSHKAHSLLLLVLLFASYENIFPSSALAPVEQDVLLGIKEVWNDPDLVLSSWTEDNDCSDWNGITCDENGHVIELKFENNQFSSSIPSSIGNLTNLQRLHLSNNSLFGPIPDSFQNFIHLTYLNLSTNNMNGSFSSSIPTLKNIQKLSLRNNQFSGTIPSSIDNLINLTDLSLRNNQFSGPIPPSIGNLTYLTQLILRNNQFSGTIPSSIGNLINLTDLFLSYNSFSGSIPSSFGKLTNIQWLWLHNNQLSGSIPASIGLLNKIKNLDFSSNYFTGTPIDCINGCDQSNNCLTNYSITQRISSECFFFCGANSTTGPCGGHGTCAFNASNIPFCTCNSGWVLPDCQKSEENSTSPPPTSSSNISIPSFVSPSKSSNINLGLIIGIIFAVLFLIIIAIIVFELFRRRKKENKNGNANDPDAKFQILPKKEFKNEIQKLVLKSFSLRELQIMTRGFDVSMILGSGGFGTVYKGIMPSGEICGVKKAHRTSIQSLHDFQKEVFALAQLNHFNIVKLLGYCDEANENILVYEYVENGSLSKMLRLPKDHPHFLNFEKRVQIAKDCALGLHYLHNLSNKQLIHRDVKSDNILLDAKFTAKIADFGLLKINEENLSTIKTSPCGTPGYVDPEYFKTLTLTNKSDVYSFGVVLLELITGRPSIFVIKDPEAPNGKSNESLVSWARPFLQSSNLDELIDPNLKEEYEPTALQSLASLAASCLRPSQKDRPGMDEVSSRLGVIMCENALEFQEDENYAINVEGNHGEFVLSNDENISSSNSAISNRVPVMSKSFGAR